MQLERYVDQLNRWPITGRSILANFDSDSIVAYQAYRRSIACWALEHQQLGGPEFSFNRMSWIKTSFLWMMYRSGWGTKVDQEVVLAVRIQRKVFDELLALAVPSSYMPQLYATEASWKNEVAGSTVRLQWDPDHAPDGSKCERKAIQLGLRDDALSDYAKKSIVSVEDMSELIAVERARPVDRLETPHESVYPVLDSMVAHRLGIV